MEECNDCSRYYFCQSYSSSRDKVHGQKKCSMTTTLLPQSVGLSGTDLKFSHHRHPADQSQIHKKLQTPSPKTKRTA